MKNDNQNKNLVPTRFGEAEIRRLGRYLQRERKALDLTLRKLAELSGVSVASIRALEAGRSSPSLTTVMSVVGALGTSIDKVIANIDIGENRVVVTRAAEQVDTEGYNLSEGLIDAALRGKILAVAPGTQNQVPDEIANAPSLCMVIGGVVVVTLEDSDRIKLLPGDTYHAQAGKVQAWVNPGKKPTHLICVTDNTRRRSNSKS